jgi:predicted PurR-regulated permease PerM
MYSRGARAGQVDDMSDVPDTTPNLRAFRDALETTIRIGLLLLLLVWCFQIVRPFLAPILWGFIIAIAAAPLYSKLTAALGGRRKLAATIFVLGCLALFIAPAVKLSGTMIGGLQDVASQLHSGELRIPPPPARVADWPLIGERLSGFWTLAADNLAAAVERLAPQLRGVAGWLLSAAADVGLGILQFIFSVIIAGVILANGTQSQAGLEKLMKRLVGENGQRFVELSESTIRSVATGIVGVALIQSTLAGIGLAVVGIPGAGLWALVTLFLCVIQLGPTLVLLPAVIYVFSTATALTAGLFLAWSVFVGLLDNFLKPLLLGRGVDAPILVIFIGAIGGFLSMGIIGLFVGSVVLVLFYTLLSSWLNEEPSVD